MEACTLLHTIFRQVHENGSPMSAAFLDLSKAFDMISHEAILEAASHAGIPSPLLRYLYNMYGTAETVVENLTVRSGSAARGPSIPYPVHTGDGEAS